MERKIGETFEYKGHKLMVVEKSDYECEKCFFYNKPCSLMLDIIGLCCGRTDKKYVIFIKQPQNFINIGRINYFNLLYENNNL